MSSALILGATGTVGYDVALAFANEGYTVYGTTREQGKAENMLSRFEIIPLVLNVRETEKWVEVAKKVDVIVEALSDYSDPTTYRLVLDALTKVVKVNKEVKIIYTGGMWTYGQQEDHDQTITEHTEKRTPAFVNTRVSVEEGYLDIGGIIIQPSMLYGRSGSLTASYFEKMDKGGGTVKVVGLASQWKSYVHAADLAKLYVLAAQRAPPKSIWLASSHTHRLVDVYKAAGHATGYIHPIITFVPPSNPFEECEGMSQRISSAKAINLLGWHPTRPSLIDAPLVYYRATQAFKSSQDR
eukprot:gene12239-14340_t